MSITILDEPLGDDMISHGSSIPCPYSIVRAGDTVSIEHDDIEWAARKASFHGRHRLAQLLESPCPYFVGFSQLYVGQ